MAPGTVDLIAAFPPADARLATFSDLAALATRALTREWVIVVAVIDTDRLPEMLARMRRYGPERIMEFSLLFTTPVATSGEPHRIALRPEALLVYGKPRVRLSGKEDVIEVRAPGSDAEGRALGLEDGMVLVVRRFASQGQVVCDPHGWRQKPRRVGSHQRRLHLHRRRRGPVAHLPGFGATGWHCNRVSTPGPGTPRKVVLLPPDRLGTPATQSHLFQEGVFAEFPPPQW